MRDRIVRYPSVKLPSHKLQTKSRVFQPSQYATSNPKINATTSGATRDNQCRVGAVVFIAGYICVSRN